MPRRLLVVVTERVTTAEIEPVVRAYAGVDAEIHVIAPASKISRLDWLTNDEDRARADAARRADQVAAAIPADAEPHVGDVDPLQAVEDAIREFPADELVIVTAPDEETSWIESDLAHRVRDLLGLPLKHLVTSADAKVSPQA